MSPAPTARQHPRAHYAPPTAFTTRTPSAPHGWGAGGAAALALAGSAAGGTLTTQSAPLTVLAGLALFAVATSAAISLRSAGWRGAVFFAAYGTTAHIWAFLALGALRGTLALAVLAGGYAVAGLAAGVALRAMRRRVAVPLALALPLAWTAVEAALVRIPDAPATWAPVGLALAGVPWIAQVADLSGVTALTALLCAIAGAAADAIRTAGDRRLALRSPLAVGAAVAIAAAYGGWRTASIPLLPAGTGAVVQPNITPAEKHDPGLLDANVGRMAALTRSLAGGGETPGLVLWPETALAGYLILNPQWADSLRALTRETGMPLMVGTVELRPDGRGSGTLHNAVVHTNAAGEIVGEVYRKQALVPVGERLPWIDPAWFGSDDPLARGFTPGAGPVTFESAIGRVGALICFESTFDRLARDQRRAGATVIALLTNDAWFGSDAGARGHLLHARLRAIATRTGVLRAATTGISAFIDPLGRVHGALPLHTAAAARYTIVRTDAMSPYVRVGDWLAWLAVAGSVGVLGMASRRNRNPNSRQPLPHDSGIRSGEKTASRSRYGTTISIRKRWSMPSPS